MGGQRCGSTSLHNYLAEHPQVGRPRIKEIQYLSIEHARGERWYRGHFPTRAYAARSGHAVERPLLVGEASPYYLFHPLAPGRAAALLPDARIIAVLRDPVAGRTRTTSSRSPSAPSRWGSPRRWTPRSTGWPASASGSRRTRPTRPFASATSPTRPAGTTSTSCAAGMTPTRPTASWCCAARISSPSPNGRRPGARLPRPAALPRPRVPAAERARLRRHRGAGAAPAGRAVAPGNERLGAFLGRDMHWPWIGHSGPAAVTRLPTLR